MDQMYGITEKEVFKFKEKIHQISRLKILNLETNRTDALSSRFSFFFNLEGGSRFVVGLL